MNQLSFFAFIVIVIALVTPVAAAQCDCQCFDGRPLLVCPVPPPVPPICDLTSCPSQRPADISPLSPVPQAPKVTVCSMELAYNEKTKQFDARRVCK